MNIEIEIDKNCVDPRIVVHTPRLTPEIEALAARLSAAQTVSVAGYREDDSAEISMLELDSVIRVYAEKQRVLAETGGGVFALRMRLYEFEALCGSGPLVRVSNSEIVNFKRVKSLNLSMAGTIMISLDTGAQTFVSRRYMGKIREYLGI